MGHDIYGLKGEEEVAYLRRSAFDKKNKTIYEALEAEDCYGGVSGNGVEQEYTLPELIEALARLPIGEDYMLERRFIADCIANYDGNFKIFFG